MSYGDKYLQKLNLANSGGQSSRESKKNKEETAQSPRDGYGSSYLDRLFSEQKRPINRSKPADTQERRQNFIDRYNALADSANGMFDYFQKRPSREDWNAYRKKYEGLDGLKSGIAEYLEHGGLSGGERNQLLNMQKGLEEISEQLQEYDSFYSQFEDDEDYNRYVAYWQDQEEKRNFDLAAGQQEIDALQKQIDEMEYDWTDQAQRVAADQKVADLQRQIAQKKRYLEQAQGIQMKEVANPESEKYDPDFASKSGYVSTAGRNDMTYEYINNQNGIRDDIRKKAWAYSHQESPFEGKGYDYMTEDEVGLYNYYYSMGGKDSAEAYLDTIQEDLNQRKAAGIYQPMKGKTGEEMVFGVAAGLDQFASGIKGAVRAVTGNGDYVAPSATQYASQMVREDLADDGIKLPSWLGGASLGQVGYDAITTTANMAPSVAVGLANPALGTAALGVSAGGSAYQEALNEGYSADQARGYGILSGASEIVMEKLLGGISAFGGNKLGKFFTRNMKNADNALKRVAKEIGGSMLSEFSEEYLQEVLTPVFSNLPLGTDEEVKLVSEEALYAGFLGAITGGLMEGPQAISSGRNATTAPSNAAPPINSETPAVRNKTEHTDQAALSPDNAIEPPEIPMPSADAEEKIAAEKPTSEESTVVGAENAPTTEPVTLESLSQKYGKQAKAMEANYIEGQDLESYDRAFQTAYDMGKSGLNKAALNRVEALSALTESQREIAYEIGEAAAAAGARAQSGKNMAQANGKTGWHKGVVRGEGVKIADLTVAFNDPQRKAYSTLSTIAEATGIDIVLYKSQANDAGEFQGEQGRFSWKDNAIYIDVNAGLRYSKDVGNMAKYTMLRTYGHEFTHFIEKWNPEQYNEFRKAVFSTMENPEDLIETRLSQDSSGKMTYDEASREVVAEAMTDILEDSQFIQELANKHPIVFESLKAKLKEFVAGIKSYFQSLGSSSREAKQLKKEVGDSISYMEDIVKRFDAVAVQAIENYQKTVAEDESTVSEAGTREDSVKNESQPEETDRTESESSENDSIPEESVLHNRTQEEAQVTEEVPQEAVTESPAPAVYNGFAITPNTERGTLEITFDSKPSEGVRDALKANKFRWSSKNKLWYGRGDQEQLAKLIEGAMTDRSSTSDAAVKEKPSVQEPVAEPATATEAAQEESADSNDAPPKAETEEAKQELRKAVRMPIQGSNMEALLQGIKSKELSMESVTLSGSVDGFNEQQRYHLVSKLLEGVYTDSEVIKIDVPYDGKFEVINTPGNVAKVLENLKVRANQEAMFDKKTVSLITSYGNVMTTELDGQKYIGNGYVLIPATEAGAEYIKKEFNGREMALPPATVKAFQNVDKPLADAPTEAKMGKTNVLIFHADGKKLYFNKNLFELLDGGQLFYTDTGGFLVMKSVDAAGNLQGILMGIKPGKDSKITDEKPSKLKSYQKKKGAANKKETKEVTNNAETAENHVQGPEESNGALREDHLRGVHQPEQHSGGDSRLLDEVEAGAVRQPEQEGASGHSGAGGSETGRSGVRPDSERDERGRSAGSDESGDLRRGVTETKDAQQLHEAVEREIEQKSTESPKCENYVIGESLNLSTGEKARFQDNVSALKLIKQLNAEGRFATKAEQETLARFVGWGGLSNAFGEMTYNRETRKREMVAKKGWEKEFEALRQLVSDGTITEEEYSGMSESTKNAHYTSMEVIGAMYDGLKGLGFQGGRMLEPSSGVGNFVGGMPSSMTAKVKSWTMVELDRITGQIAKYLYPNNDVRIEGFQDANIPNGYMDVAIGNVPFGNYGVVDRTYPKRVTKSIHNYFFAKSLDKVRPGGIVMFITSSFTMNSADSSIRQYIMDRADLLGAIRLPNTAFQGNAGTEVVTDILVLKKRAPGTRYHGENFLEAPAKQIPGSWRAVNVNEYFQNHPEMVLGTEAVSRGMYGAETLTYNPLENAGTLGDQIRKAFLGIEGKMEYPKKTPEQAQWEAEQAVRKPKKGSYRKKLDGTVINGLGETVTDADAAKRISGMIDVRDAYRNLVERIQQGRTEKEIAAARKYLNQVYDTFVKENGYINDPKNKRAIAEDPDRFSIQALETDYRKGGKGETASAAKADIFTKDTVKANVTVSHAESVSDGLVVSINTTGGVDAALIARLTGKTIEEVNRELIDSRMAFKTRDGSLQAPETYLSGNVRAKLREAEALAHTDKDFENNVEELRRVIPKDVPYDEIHVSPGAVWVPTDVYADFIAYMLGSRNDSYRGPDVQVGYSAQTGEFKIKLNNARLRGNYRNTQEWGTSRRSFLDLFEALLGNGNVTVTDKEIDENGNERRVANKDETAAAQEKADKIKEEFRKWIWSDEARRTELAKLYNETYNALANPKYDGKDLTVNGLNAMFSLREHQANAVKRIISSGGNTLLAHRVGAGKTLEMAAAAMKLRELGVVKKPLFAVPKSLVAQWGLEFHNYFPAAKLLVADDKSFDKANRKIFTNNIANGDFDAVIVSYEQFGKIPMSPVYQQKFLQEQIDEVLDAIAEEKAENGKGSLTVKQMEKKVSQLKVKLEKLKIQAVDSDNVDFETLGIDALFVDEAHNFKNLQYTTKMQNVGGLGNADGSQRAFDLYTKIRYLQQLNGGRGIVFATATPVMNSMAEMYIMQKYLQSDMLKQLGITTFDAWAKQFGEVVNTYEIKPSGQGVRAKQVFSNFKNLNELQLMFRSFSDVLTEVPGLKIPKMRGGGVQIVECEPGKFQKDFMKSLEKRANNVKNVDPSVDNMLKITSDGRKVSYTQRMIDPTLPYEAGCKLYRCCENILKEYKASKSKKVVDPKTGEKITIRGTQIVFCDMATPKGKDKSKANADAAEGTEDVMDTESARLYEDMRDYLVKKGIPRGEIAFIHEANSDQKRKQLFADMNAGKVRVLIGSTGKMGVGMNAQRCVTAIHHLDAPWRPGDVEQRDGRAFRQGNLNEDVAKYVYVTTGSFDARLWDILDRKSGFINQIMNGDDVGRNAEDTGDVTLSAAEVKALASGNPMIKESVELADELQKLNGLKRTHDSAVTRARTKLMKDTQTIAGLRASMEAVKTDIQKRADTFMDEKFSMQIGSKTLSDRKDAGEAMISAILRKAKSENEFAEIGSFAGFKILVAKSGGEYSGVMQGTARYGFKVHINSPTLMVGQMAKRIADLETELAAQNALLEQTIADQAAQEKMIAQPFERQSELDEKRSRYEYVMSELNKTDQQFGSDETEQHQERTDTLTDREVLAMAAENIPADNLDAAEADALQIFRDRLDALDALQEERRELGRTYKKQQFGANVDRAAAKETLEKMHAMDARIREAENKVLSAETAPALKKVLPRARRIVEQHQKDRDDVILKRWRDRRNNAAAIKKYREKIAKDVSDLSGWVLSPSNKNDLKHVPDALKNTVIPFLTSIDFTSKRQLRGGEATKADERFMKRLNALEAAMQDNITESGLYSGYNDLPPDFMERLGKFIKTAQAIVNQKSGQFVINQMTSQEMKELSSIVTALKRHIQDFNKFHANAIYQHVYDAGDATIKELNEYQDAKSRNKAGEAMNNFVFWQQIRPAYAFERFGRGGKAIYDGLRRGQAKLAFNTKEIVEFSKNAYKAEEVEAWEKEVKTVKIGDRSVRMKVTQIMSFYELLKREQARGHIFGQGIRIATFRNGKEKISEVGQALTLEDAEQIISVLSPRQIEVADQLQKFMQEKGGAWGNYVSVKRFGEKQFGEDHYFPINSDGRHLEADAGENLSAASLYALLNMGFTKKLQEKANNRLVLYSIFNVFSNHMASMAQYNSMALPVLDALKWFNYQQKEDATVLVNGEERLIHAVKDSVRDQLGRVYGIPEEIRPGSGKRGYAESFILNVLKAFNGTETQGISSDSPGLNSLRHYNMAQVAFNLRVVLQQPLAITRAAMIIDYQSILRGLRLSPSAIQKNVDEMRKYSGIAAWKDLGFYDTNISRGLTDIIKHNETFRDKVGENGMWLAEKADQLTWAAMWSACKEEVQRKHRIKPGDEHFFEIVSSLFEDVIYKTQVVDSVLTKNEYLRSKGFFARATGSFMSEPTTTASMLADAFDKYRMDLQKKGATRREAWEKNRRNIGRTAYVYGVSAVILAAVQAVADAFRDDDEYEKYGDKWVEAFTGNVLDELMPFNKLPLVSDVYELGKELLRKIGVDTYGNPPSSVFMQWYDSLVKGVEIIHARITGDERNLYTWYGGIYKLLQAASGIFGLPMAAFTREVVTVWNNTVASMAPSLKIKTYEQKPKTEIKYSFMDGYMTTEEAKQALIRDGGLTVKEAEEEANVYAFIRSNPQYADVSGAAISKYQEYCEEYGVEPDTFFSVWDFNSEAIADVDEDGKPIPGSKKEKVLDFIDSQNLTRKQKDSLYYAFGWAESTIGEAPWN